VTLRGRKDQTTSTTKSVGMASSTSVPADGLLHIRSLRTNTFGALAHFRDAAAPTLP
jgi:hypothetical protein